MPYAAPTGLAVSALVGVRNVIVNGAMLVNQIDQLGTPISIPLTVPRSVYADNYFNIDNCGIYNPIGLTSAIINDAQIEDHPFLPIAEGIATCKSIAVTTAEVAVAAGELFLVQMPVEAITGMAFWNSIGVLQFWAKSPKIGTHYVAIFSSGAGRSYVTPFNIAAVNTWQQFTLGINFGENIASEASGEAFRITFPLIAGANFRTANLSQWINGEFHAGPDQKNLLDTIGNTFRITDVQLEAGVVSTPFDRENFADVLQRCLRYYWQTFPYGIRPGLDNVSPLDYTVQATAAGKLFDLHVAFPAPMRLNPTITFFNPIVANSNWRNITLGADSGAPTVPTVNYYYATVRNAQVVGDLVNHQILINATFNARM